MADNFLVTILARLNEAQSRWFAAREAIALGRGGIKAIEQLTGISRRTIQRGIGELKDDNLPPEDRVRRTGGGRKPLEDTDPTLIPSLNRIMEESTAGDPMCRFLRWTHKSAYTIAKELTRQGHPASESTVGRRLRQQGYSLQSNRKNKEGLSPPERDAQFRYINRLVKEFLPRGDPVISVDAKKRENVGDYKNPGKTWRKRGSPQEVDVHDFATDKAIPYGTFDVERNEGFVNVGVSNETAEFAVESIRRWWRLVGKRHYPGARRLLICADCGGSNGNRRRTWKYYLQELADEFGLCVTVCHYPPGTSKWNKIEHRLFSFISLNWRGQPLVSYETVVNLIGGTRTRGGLRVKARLDSKEYEKGIEITDDQMASLNIELHQTHPQWNYTISSHKGTPRNKG